MSDCFIGEIRIFAGNYAPRGWALCNGQLLPLTQNTALYSLLGTTYGGDGKSTFALPNLQGRAPLHPGTGPGLTQRTLGQAGGSPTVSLLESHLPAHTHTPMGDGNGGTASTGEPTNNVWGSATSRGGASMYTDNGARLPMSPYALDPAGGSLPHNNMQPYLGLNFIIALQGVFPQRP